ncbi:XRE family transcriptional regulator [Agrobacterium sp. AGB01]|uniref:XRE family transcriptional regulator n=1 Tax=Agrobacterium sp. AGB01 TaxID=2769302 RepID=UPI00177C9CF5|nr:S24 family peptidase [Agrobacterium sp. AGB01]MBD9390155.1 XRE family transcriptional regulator [Agrobacterium sp. AGB01]
MNNTLIERINQRLKELGKSAQRVSIDATGAKDTVRKILDGTTKNPRVDTVEKIATALDTTAEWLMGKEDKSEATVVAQSELAPAAASNPQQWIMPNDIPVRGTAAGSLLRGAFQLSSDAIDYVRRPPALMGAKDIYALYVEGVSMEPQYFQGDLIYVHPHKPPRFGDVVVIQCGISHEDTEASIGILTKRTEQAIIITKRNPVNSTVEIKRANVIAVHKVLTTNELFGV